MHTYDIQVGTHNFSATALWRIIPIFLGMWGLGRPSDGKLTINGNASILGNNPLRLYNAAANANGGIRNASTDYTQIFGINGTQIMNSTLASALVTVLDNGNVGIGTTAP